MACDTTGRMHKPANEIADRVASIVAASGLSSLHQLSATDEVAHAVTLLANQADGLSEVERELLRTEAVGALKGSRAQGNARLIDAALRASRREHGRSKDERIAGLINEPDPWPHPLELETLLDELTTTIRAHVCMSEVEADAVALWVLHTHVLDAAAISPRLAILSPTKRCGKTTLLKLLGAFSRRALPASSVSAAAIYRVMDTASPTLLIDEADTFLTHNEELRGILNAGHDREMAKVVRSGRPDDGVVVDVFDAWGAVAIAAIGQLPDTLIDRSIVIRLRRKRKSERVVRLRRRERERLVPLQRRCIRWAQDNLNALKEARPPELSLASDRAADNWEALVAIGSLAAGNWAQRTVATAEGITKALEADELEGQTAEVLLKDVHDLFQAGAIKERVSMRDLCERLSGIDGAPWSTHNAGKSLTTAQLGRLLRTFRIKPHTVRLSAALTSKGFQRADFNDAFTRYIRQPVTSVTPTTSLEERRAPRESQATGVTGRDSPEKMTDSDDVTDVTAHAGDAGSQ